MGQIFTWAVIFTWVAWVKFFLRGLCEPNIFLRGSLCGSKNFVSVQNLCVGQLVLRGAAFVY